MDKVEAPRWMQDKHFNEVLFCEDFLTAHPTVCVSGSFFTVDGRVTDEESIRKQIYEMLRPHFSCGLAKRASGLLEMLKLEAYVPDLPLHEDRIHVANGTLFLSGEFHPEKEFCRNRLPVRFNPNAPQPIHWLHFLSDLLEETDILTLQEYLGYCLIPTNRGQVMMLLKGNGGEGKSRIGVVMQKLLGSNLKNGSIAKVEHSPFARADLEHELLMVDDDMKMEALKSTHYLKSLITAEMPMDLERKGEQSYQGQMYVRFLAFSNGDLESLYDHSDGFYRRQLILSVKKITPERKYRAEAERQIAEAGCRTRSDSVRVVEALITASPEFFKGKKRSEIKSYFQEALDFIKQNQNPETIISAVVHMDEKTPHMHLSFVPLTENGRLSAKEIVGNKKKLTQWQDRFWEHMVKKYPDLERGESASKTGRTHIPPRLFKEAVRLNRLKEQIMAILNDTNPFNKKAKAEELAALLDKYIPGAEAMRTKLRKYDAAYRELTAEKTALEKQLGAVSKESVRKKLEISQKLGELDELHRMVTALPDEVIRAYTAQKYVHHGRMNQEI